MSYVKEVLQPGETVRFVTKTHWIEYAPGVLLILLGCAIYAFSLNVERMNWLIVGAALVVLAVGAAYLFRAWFDRWTTEIAVTDRRIIYKQGFIRRKTIEMHMDKVESVDVDQSILGRLLGYGDIMVRGVGTGFEPLRMVASAIELRNHVTAE